MRRGLGEPVTITRIADSSVQSGVMVIIDRGIPIDQGEAIAAGYTMTHWYESVPELAQSDRVETGGGEVFLVSRKLESDDLQAVRLLLKQ